MAVINPNRMIIITLILLLYTVLGFILQIYRTVQKTSLKLAIFLSSLPMLLLSIEIIALIFYPHSSSAMNFGVLLPYFIILTIIAFVITFVLGLLVGAIIDHFKSLKYM